MLLSQGEVLYDGDRIAGMDSANDGEDQENDTPDEPDMPEEPDTPEDQQTVQDQTPEDDRQDGRQDTQTPDKDDPSSGDGTTSEAGAILMTSWILWITAAAPVDRSPTAPPH